MLVAFGHIIHNLEWCKRLVSYFRIFWVMFLYECCIIENILSVQKNGGING